MKKKMKLTAVQDAAFDYAADECQCQPGGSNDGDCVAQALQNGFFEGVKWEKARAKKAAKKVKK